MKKTIFAIIACVTLMLAACDIETSDNGNLDGIWQLTAVDTLATGGHADMRMKNTQWDVQGCLLQLRNELGIYFCHFKHADGTLTMETLRLWSKELQDPEVTDIADVQPYGVNAFNEQFKVTILTSDKMVLQSEMLKLSFRKY